MKKHPATDANGIRVKIGDLVRIVGVPDLSGMARDCEKETRPVFEHLVGKYKQVKDFDENGLARLAFRIQKGPSVGLHTVFGLSPIY